jgi:hypothetical protein
MQLNLARLRLGGAVAGLLVLGIYLMGGGSLSMGGKSTVQIEFGMYPDEFEGCEVVIDGETVGTLRRVGSAYRNGFPVKDGDHTIELRHPDVASRPTRFTAGAGASHVMLIADFGSDYENGKTRPVVVLNW